MERVGQLLIGDVAARQPPRQRQPADRRHDRRVDAIADRDFDDAVAVLQLGDVDDRLALAADVDKRHRRPDGHDGALDGLALLELLRLLRRREHRGEIFFGIAHKLDSPDGSTQLGSINAEPAEPAEFRSQHGHQFSASFAISALLSVVVTCAESLTSPPRPRRDQRRESASARGSAGRCCERRKRPRSQVRTSQREPAVQSPGSSALARHSTVLPTPSDQQHTFTRIRPNSPSAVPPRSTHSDCRSSSAT